MSLINWRRAIGGAEKKDQFNAEVFAQWLVEEIRQFLDGPEGQIAWELLRVTESQVVFAYIYERDGPPAIYGFIDCEGLKQGDWNDEMLTGQAILEAQAIDLIADSSRLSPSEFLTGLRICLNKIAAECMACASARKRFILEVAFVPRHLFEALPRDLTIINAT